MREPIIIVFRHNDDEHSFTIYPTEPDWWVYIEDLFDIHYCEDYNEICVYQSQDYSTTIHKQKINNN
jgi:hypothetical protein